MSDIQNPLVTLDAQTCWERLATQQIGRIVTRVGETVDIFPIAFVVDGESVVFRTAEGNKLAELVISSDVLFEADELTDGLGWSVVVRGKARRLENADEIIAADELPLAPPLATVKRNYVRIDATSISGREFVPGTEPARDGAQDY